MNRVTSQESIWHKLIGKKTVKGSAPLHQGRIDLRRFVLVPDPGKTYVKLEGIKFDGIDFTGSRFSHLSLFDCEIRNCLFDDCRFPHCRIWDTNIFDCSMKNADISDLGFSGSIKQRNLLKGIDFSGADYRKGIAGGHIFQDCTFRRTKLKEREFHGTEFRNCVFEGKLNDVTFVRDALKVDFDKDPGERSVKIPSGLLEKVDFRGCTFRYVEFRNLDLSLVSFPKDNDLVVIEKDYAEWIEKSLRSLKGKKGEIARRLYDSFLWKSNFILPQQQRGIVNLSDIREAQGVEGVQIIQELLNII